MTGGIHSSPLLRHSKATFFIKITFAPWIRRIWIDICLVSPFRALYQIRTMFFFFKNIIFLGWLCGVLASLSLGLVFWSVKLSADIVLLTSEAAVQVVKHRKELSKVLAKARLRRVVVMMPFAGAGMGAYFEERDYQVWKLDNPNGSRRDYGCEVALVTADLLDEFLAEIPNFLSVSKNSFSNRISRCSSLE